MCLALFVKFLELDQMNMADGPMPASDRQRSIVEGTRIRIVSFR